MSNKLEAYKRIEPKLKGIRQRIFSHIEGKTISELSLNLNIAVKTLSGRISELEQYGFITSKLSKGTESVWQIVPESMRLHYRIKYSERRISELQKTLNNYQTNLNLLYEINSQPTTNIFDSTDTN